MHEHKTSTDQASEISIPGEAIPGAGVDASPAQRPGVPMEKDPPAPAGLAHWAEPQRQHDPGNILKRKGLATLTPVFGDTVAPRGLSGLMRRSAYDIPEHYTSHWLLLLLADRVDMVEHDVKRALPVALPIVAGGLVVLALAGSLRRRRSVWRRLFA